MKATIKELPENLYMHGFMETHPSERQEWDIADLNKVREFVRLNFQSINSLNRNISSYGIKHLVERKMGSYVKNGVLIAAMILEGYKYRWRGGKFPNCYFNVSNRSLSKILIK